jgi:hypothetical protein
LLTFLGSLAALGLGGLRILRSQTGLARLGTAACLAGIAGELVWGLQDVLWVTPPFLSFPVWGLVGLLLASGRLGEIDPPLRASDDQIMPTRIGPEKVRLILVGLAILVVLLPSLTYAQYSGGYLAFQEQRWEDAAESLQAAARSAPLNAHLPAMLGQTYLELGDTGAAVSAYQRAAQLKQAYSPYQAQLGWLAWLQGNRQKAKGFFEDALEMDPGEIWQAGLRANLGLMDAADGRPAMRWICSTKRSKPILSCQLQFIGRRTLQMPRMVALEQISKSALPIWVNHHLSLRCGCTVIWAFRISPPASLLRRSRGQAFYPLTMCCRECNPIHPRLMSTELP